MQKQGIGICFGFFRWNGFQPRGHVIASNQIAAGSLSHKPLICQGRSDGHIIPKKLFPFNQSLEREKLNLTFQIYCSGNGPLTTDN